MLGSGYRAVIVATLTLVHQPQAVEALERRLRDEILTANLSRTPVSSADERFTVERVLGHGASSVVCRAREIKLDRLIALGGDRGRRNRDEDHRHASVYVTGGAARPAPRCAQ